MSESVSKLQTDQDDAVQDPSNISKILMNKSSQHSQKQSHAAKARQIMSARQMQKLVENDEPVFLIVVRIVVRTSNDFVSSGRRIRGEENNLLTMQQ